jgi:hypothetical protein
MKTNPFQRAVVSGLYVLFFFLGTCMPKGAISAEPPKESVFRDKVIQLWTARQKKDWNTVYDMTDTKFQHQTTREKYISRTHLDVKGFEIRELDVKGNEGSSFVVFKTIKMGMPFEISIREVWIREADGWRLKRSDPRTPFDTPTKHN